jgi:hypothetical protein
VWSCASGVGVGRNKTLSASVETVKEFVQKEMWLEMFSFIEGRALGNMSRYSATPLIIALSPGHSNITTFPPSSPIATGEHLDRAS